MQGVDGNSYEDRERLVATAVAEIGAGRGAIETAHALTRWSVRLLDVSGAGIMLTDARGALHSVMVSSDLVRTLEAVELRHGRGPCVESHRRGRVVVHADVHRGDARWPEFGVLASAGGVRAAHAVPVLDHGSPVGVLNLFRTTIGGLAEPDAVLARTFADTAGAAIGQHRSLGPRLDAEELTVAIADAALVHRATGMLAVRLQLDVDSARAVLRRVANDRGLELGILAGDVVARRTTISLPLSIATEPLDASGTD